MSPLISVEQRYRHSPRLLPLHPHLSHLPTLFRVQLTTLNTSIIFNTSIQPPNFYHCPSHTIHLHLHLARNPFEPFSATHHLVHLNRSSFPSKAEKFGEEENEEADGASLAKSPSFSFGSFGLQNLFDAFHSIHKNS
ncbi:hypothetical protein AAC387_Pa05g1626 [Persea americana]